MGEIARSGLPIVSIFDIARGLSCSRKPKGETDSFAPVNQSEAGGGLPFRVEAASNGGHISSRLSARLSSHLSMLIVRTNRGGAVFSRQPV